MTYTVKPLLLRSRASSIHSFSHASSNGLAQSSSMWAAFVAVEGQVDMRQCKLQLIRSAGTQFRSRPKSDRLSDRWERVTVSNA